MFRSSCRSCRKNLVLIFSDEVVPAAKRVNAELLEFAAAETAEVVGGKEHSGTAAESVGNQTPIKQLGIGGKKRIGAIGR